MPKFMISYIGGNKPSNGEEDQKHMSRYMEWITNLGETAISPMNPMTNVHSISPNGEVKEQSTTDISGFTIIETGSYQEAVNIAKNCPFLDIGGTLEVSQLVEMDND